MGPAVYTLFAVAHAALAVVAVRMSLRDRTWTACFIAVLAVTLAYDNAVIVLGATIGEGATLEALTWPRFTAHALLTPVAIAVLVDQARRLGLPGAGAARARIGAWIVVEALIAYGVVELLALDLVPEEALGLLRYASADPAPPVPAILTVLAMIAVGWRLRAATGWSVLLVLGLVTLFGSGAPPVDDMMVFGNLVEIVFVAALLLTERRAAAAAVPAAAVPPRVAHA